MSEDRERQNPSESETSPSETPTPEASESAPGEGSPAPPPKPSPFKQAIINILRSTINLLERAVKKLESEPTSEPGEGVLASVLAPVRGILPESLNQRLPDWGLATAIASIVAIVIWTSSSLLSPKPPEIAQLPSEQPTPPVEAPTVEAPPVEAPEIREIPPVELEQPTEEIPEPELTEPEKSPPVVEEPQPTETVAPQLPLTPEQTLIAAIQERVAEVTSEYADGLIQSLKANFAASLLQVKISPQWYELSFSRQDKLASEILQRARDLDFSEVEITDLQGDLVARTAVVGSQMIILKR
ncbi:hypothetical protein [Phormidium sp. CCY1219]|uniref:hypothetical protein n=1 Tax=Phormidium sp. CCY1219 TaxID=2886104 RepID=UPI002D1E8678|nr:hypothetical protein [Phormidium sp. CCY1219]MEB3830357.1 hypothetical protein [Phormidium sp. CCY1219]